MHITNINVANFRGFIEKEIHFAERFTVLIGDNGSGKTAVLEFLAVALGGYLNGFTGVASGRNILPAEVRLQTYLQGDVITTEPRYPVSVTCSSEINDNFYHWSRTLNSEKGRTTRIEAREIIKYAENLQSEVREGKPSTLPVLGYYGTGRLWAQKKAKSKVNARINSRLLGYTDCLDPISNQKLFSSWFKKMTQIKLQKGKEISGLTVVKKAIEKSLESLTSENEKVNIYYDLELDEIIVVLQDGRELSLNKLSDGYRNTLCMVGDIAYRMSVLNPHLMGDAANETPGVILIDEIDLHLHPKWQRNIVNDFKRTFPKVQFIVTTHSPIVISSCAENEVVKLTTIGNDTKIEYLNNTKGWLAENIITELMDVETSRDKETEETIGIVRELYYRKLDGGVSEAENALLVNSLKNLSSHLPENDPVITLTKR